MRMRPNAEAINRKLQQTVDTLEADREFIARCNIGGEFMEEKDKTEVKRIARYRYVNQKGEERALLSDEEIKNLTIARGTLTAEEREIINYHIVATIKMLWSSFRTRNTSGG